MPLSINTNMMAVNSARNLGTIYRRLGAATNSLSLGLRIKSAADDPVNLTVRELMRGDIAFLNQGLRNATDGVSLIQTAEGALAIIDEKLTRMKELAEEAATGTFTAQQREIMNSEYQAMAAEVDRIAGGVDFNGVKLLDGSIKLAHGGRGMKFHFGTGNNGEEDYYFVSIDDMRATSNTGLQVGGDAQNDVWRRAGESRPGGRLDSPDQVLFTSDNQAFSYGYNFNADPDLEEADLSGPSYLGGVYNLTSGAGLSDLVNAVNQGTQSRIRINFGGGGDITDLALGQAGVLDICLGDDVYQFGSGAATVGSYDQAEVFHRIDVGAGGTAGDAASALAANIAAQSKTFWAVADVDNNQAFVFHREGGDHDYLKGCDVDSHSAATAAAQVTWTNMADWSTDADGTSFALGGEDWLRLQTVGDGQTFDLVAHGRDVGDNFDLAVVNAGEIGAPGLESVFGFTRGDFEETRDAADSPWEGAEIRTQSAAQAALVQLDEAIRKKDKARTDLGAIQTRLENTITQLTIQRENIQGAESKISDVDLAVAMTEFNKENILSQVAVSIMAQSNTNAELALSLIL